MGDYYIVEWVPGCGWSERYDMLCGPEGFKCLLTEPEDRRWCRDGRAVIDELNRLSEKLKEKPWIDEVRKLLEGAFHVLRSYQNGNGSAELAKSMADAIEKRLKEKGNEIRT